MTTSNRKYEEIGLIRINRTVRAPVVLSTSNAQYRYREKEVVVALYEMQHSKCCYCEIYIADSGSGKQVEHFRPRSQYKGLLYDWKNLLLACADCNNAKLDEFPLSVKGEPLLLDPSDPTLDPEDHIEFVVSDKQAIGDLPLGLAIPREQSPRGEESIRVIKLSGGHHIKRRNEILSRLRSSYISLLTETKRTACGTGDTLEIDRLKNELQEANGDDKAYAGVARTFHREHRLDRFGIPKKPAATPSSLKSPSRGVTS